MINAAEQIFERGDGEFSSLIWLDFSLDGSARPLIFLIHHHGWWKGFPDLWDGEPAKDPHLGTGRGFAFLIEKAGLSSLLGEPRLPEKSFQTEVETKPFQTEEIEDGTFWEFSDSSGRLLKLYSPGMNWHMEYP